MSDLFRLDGRVALVTGASRGLGFAMAEALATHGAQVIVNARDPAAVAEAAARLGGEALAFDVSDAAATTAAMGEIERRHGRLDILVNNAGVQHRVPVTEWTDADFERVVAINLTACFRLAREAARLMLPRRSDRPVEPDRLEREERARADPARTRRRHRRAQRNNSYIEQIAT